MNLGKIFDTKDTFGIGGYIKYYVKPGNTGYYSKYLGNT